MDRVLLIIDDIQYSRHVEMTLRKVGFDVEVTNNEFNLNETILTFNPDYIVCRGSSNRISTLNVGKKLKESTSKHNGRVILIFPENYKVAPEDLIKIKMDLLLVEPLSTLRLAVHLFSLAGGDIEFIKDKLLKFAITDNQFRNYEQQMLRTAGMTIDSEIQIVSNMTRIEPAANTLVRAEPTEEEKSHKTVSGDINSAIQESKAAQAVLGKKLTAELAGMENELGLRIDSYNRTISKVDQDLSAGLKKRQTKMASNKLRKDLMDDQKADTNTKSAEEQDAERIRFTKALFKK